MQGEVGQVVDCACLKARAKMLILRQATISIATFNRNCRQRDQHPCRRQVNVGYSANIGRTAVAYYSIRVGGNRSVNAVWTYETPYAAVAAIKDQPLSGRRA